MRIDIFDQTVELATNRTIVLHHARDAEIVCTRGLIWITEDPLRNDILLAAGKSHRIPVDAMVFVTAVSPSAVWLREPVRLAARPARSGARNGVAMAFRRLIALWRQSSSGNRAAA